eukprot:13976910-Alexandrium_andersonii.AAC.1
MREGGSSRSGNCHATAGGGKQLLGGMAACGDARTGDPTAVERGIAPAQRCTRDRAQWQSASEAPAGAGRWT